jgi:hypothetical protein
MRTRTSDPDRIITVEEAKAYARPLKIDLDDDTKKQFMELARKLELEPDEAAERLLAAAIHALKDEDHFIWPLYLVQAGQVIGTGRAILS